MHGQLVKEKEHGM